MNAIITSPFIVPEQKNIFTSGAILAIFRNVLATSSTERGNSNYYTANTSTPFQSCFFVCYLSTPKENNRSKFGLVTFLSMVACSGQRLIVGCFPCITVFHPVTSYRQITVESEAIAQIIYYTEQIAMIFKFLCLDREADTYQTAVLTLEAPNENEARWQLSSRWKLLLDRPIAKFSNKQEVI